jgi:hypothetical protein
MRKIVAKVTKHKRPAPTHKPSLLGTTKGHEAIENSIKGTADAMLTKFGSKPHAMTESDHPAPTITVEPMVEDKMLTEATEVLCKLAHCSPALLGTAHGHALVTAAKAWVASYVTVKSDEV